MADTDVDTKKVEGRRTLAYASLDEFISDLDEMQAAHQAGTLEWLGGWTPGQIFQHLARFTACTMDGFPGKGPPAPLRWIFILLFKRKAVGGASPPPGFKIPRSVAYLNPDAEASFEQGMGELRAQLSRLQSGTPCIPASPVFGRLTRDQWITIQLGHAALHMSFLRARGS